MKRSFLNAYQFCVPAASLCLVATMISFFGCSDGPTARLGNQPAPSSASTDCAATVSTELSSSSTTATAASQIQNVVAGSPVAVSTQVIAPQANSAVPRAAGIQENIPVAPAQTPQPAGMLEKAGDLFDRAKSTTGSTAMGAKDWVQDKIGGAAEASSAASQDTLKWATDTFESLKSQGLTTANDTSEWLSQDWKNMESWEYKIIRVSNKTDEQATAELNELGKNGWECYQQSGSVTDQRFYLKKRRESYLRHLPFKDFIKLVPLMQQGNH